MLVPSSTCYRVGQVNQRFFSTSANDEGSVPPPETPAKKKRGRPSKASKAAQETAESQVDAVAPKATSKPRAKRTSKKQQKAESTQSMYVLKFNSPILPYSKFPLTHNKYIQEFLKMYENDRDQIDKIIGVHFPQNSNSKFKDQVGIEIKITKKNNQTIIESDSAARFRVLEYDSETNFCQAEPFEDTPISESFGMDQSETGASLNQNDLISSELFELKNLWHFYNKRINQLLMILPQEVLNRYDLVIKSLQPPIFDVSKYPSKMERIDIFNEIVFKMGQYYFAVFQAIFTKDNESMRPMLSSFMQTQDSLMRSRKLINLYEELVSIIDKKLFYVQKTAEEFKERSKTNLLEQAYQKVLEDSKKSDKEKYQGKLDAVVNMPESTRKVVQEEINSLEGKNDMEAGRKVAFLNQVFRLPWDSRVDPYWDVQYSKQVLEQSHYGMSETKERILEFIAKNKRVKS